MSYAFIELGLFTAKAIIIVVSILIILIMFFMLLTKGKIKQKGRLVIKNLNERYDDYKITLLTETLSKKLLKLFFKEKKAQEKTEKKSALEKKKIYVLNFVGDIKASATANLREEITSILSVATSNDEVVLRLESPGGVVYGYGFAAAQLMRLRAKNIRLTVFVDKVAASGGYMMAVVANKIFCSPFAIIGSIGVVMQLPNFNRLLKEKHIDFEQHTAGEFKRTLTVFGENTDEGRQKMQHELEDIHNQFKQLIKQHRPELDIQKVATGEHWTGQQALQLQLVDELKTSDEYLFEQHSNAQIFEICYEIKKSLSSKLGGAANKIVTRLLEFL